MGFILFHFVMIFKKFHSYNFVTNLLLYLLLILMHSPLAHVNCCVEHDVKDNILIRHSNRIFGQGKDGRLILIFNHSLHSVYFCFFGCQRTISLPICKKSINLQYFHPQKLNLNLWSLNSFYGCTLYCH